MNIQEKIDSVNYSCKKNVKSYMCKKDNGDIVFIQDDEVNQKAKNKLEKIRKEYDDIPERYRKNWDEVSLYHAKGDVEKAHAILINPEKGAYDLRNKMNNLTGKEWTKFTKSWFLFNALNKDLKQEKKLLKNSEDHPATFSPTMIEQFVKFFTKEGDKVLDPFAGIGSTLEACKRTSREGYGIELNKKYYEDILRRVPAFSENIKNKDAREVKDLFNDVRFDYSVTSPPYWDVLNRSTKDFRKNRDEKDLDVNYSDSDIDLGNIDDYKLYLKELSEIYFKIYELLKPNSYITIIVKNVKKEGKLYPIAWDLARELSEKYTLKDEKIWIQDKQRLAPYGYPYAWSSNILHHYCIIMRKEGKE